MHLVPPLMSLLGQHQHLDVKSFSRLHSIFSGAAPLGPTVATRILERFGRPDLVLQEGVYR
jgi:4-coumarate--CoA ligase